MKLLADNRPVAVGRRMHGGKPVDISLIVPAFNEEHYLPRLLETVERARANFVHGLDGIEVIVADNGSTDRSAAVALERGCIASYTSKNAVSPPRAMAALRSPPVASSVLSMRTPRFIPRPSMRSCARWTPVNTSAARPAFDSNG